MNERDTVLHEEFSRFRRESEFLKKRAESARTDAVDLFFSAFCIFLETFVALLCSRVGAFWSLSNFSSFFIFLTLPAFRFFVFQFQNLRFSACQLVSFLGCEDAFSQRLCCPGSQFSARLPALFLFGLHNAESRRIAL